MVAHMSFAQSNLLKVPSFYQTIEFEEGDIYKAHRFFTKDREEAILEHKRFLDYNDMDTSRTKVYLESSTPIFSSFISRVDDKTLIITFVDLKDDGVYESTFFEAKNKDIELFLNKDGELLTVYKKK